MSRQSSSSSSGAFALRLGDTVHSFRPNNGGMDVGGMRWDGARQRWQSCGHHTVTVKEARAHWAALVRQGAVRTA